MKNIALQLVGWIGAGLILFGYFLVSFSVIESNSTMFQLLNLFGALGIALETFSKKDYQPMELNTVWMVIAAVALVRAFVAW